MHFKEYINPKLKIVRNGNQFKAYLGETQVGQAYVHPQDKGHWILGAIDVFNNEDEGGFNYQRKGYGTQLIQAIAAYLKQIGATTLSSSNEGSGTVQILDRVFGRQNVHHYHAGEPINYDKAVHIMDKDYGYTRTTVHL